MHELCVNEFTYREAVYHNFLLFIVAAYEEILFEAIHVFSHETHVYNV